MMSHVWSPQSRERQRQRAGGSARGWGRPVNRDKVSLGEDAEFCRWMVRLVNREPENGEDGQFYPKHLLQQSL